MVRWMMPHARLKALSLLAAAALLSVPAARAEDAAAGIDDAQLLRAARAASTVYQYKLHGLIGDLASSDPAVRLQALSDLGHLSDPAVVPVLLPWLQASNRSPAEIIAAASALSVAGAEAAVPVLHGLLKHPDHEVRATAMNVLTSISKIQPNDYKARSDDADDVIRGSSLTELGTLAQSDAAALLVKGLAKDVRPHIRRMCAIGLGNLGDKAMGPNLTDGSEVRQFANSQDQIDFVASGSEQGKRYGQQGQGTGRMPGFAQMMTPDQIQAIVEYERGL